MKIEFVKEQKLDGTLMYYTQIDGHYFSDSLSFDEEKAYERYKLIVKSKGNKELLKEVLESNEF